MTRACHIPVHAATGGAFTDDEVDAIVSRLAKRAQRKVGPEATSRARIKAAAADKVDRAALRQAAVEMTREEVFGALIQRRAEAAAAAARDARRPAMDALPGDAADQLRAYNVGSERQGVGTGFSVEAEQLAEASSVVGELTQRLDEVAGLTSRLSNFWGVGERGFERKVVTERARAAGARIEATGDAAAEHAGRVLHEVGERVRRMQNDAGAWIGKIEGYAGAQAHDAVRVAGGFWREFGELARAAKAGEKTDWSAAQSAASARGFRAWRDDIRPKLDDRTFAGLTDDELESLEAANGVKPGVLDEPTDPVERFLYAAWWHIVTGRTDVLQGASDLGEFRPPAGKARSVSQSRVLHFKSPDDWMDYHERYGRGSVLAGAVRELERGAKNAALMRRWGPAPEAAYANEVDRQLGKARAAGDTAAAGKLSSWKTRAQFDQLTGAGNAPENVRVAMIARGIRTQQSLAKLGGVVISALPDLALASQTMKRAGGTWLQGYGGALSGILRLDGPARARAAELVDAGARAAAGELLGRFNAADGPLGWSSWASRLFFKLNGLEWWTSGLRRGMAGAVTAHFGAEAAEHAFEALSPGTRETLQRFGIDAGDWARMRAGVRSDLGDGQHYLTFDGLQGPAALKYRAMIGAILDDAETAPRARERAGLTMGTKPGTPVGEALRFMTQFRAFNQTIVGRHVAPSVRGYAGQAPVALMAHLVLASTLLGYMSMQAKQILRGRTPRSPFDPDTGEFKWGQAGDEFLASALQGGGLGIYGDFLFGEFNRGGGSPIATLGGPAVGEFEQALKLYADLRDARDYDTGKWAGLKALTAGGIKFGVNNAPFLNLFYTRLALDYTVLWRLQEASSPGYLQRYEQRVEKQTGSRFLISPSRVVNGG